jgi:hypothetical protein
MYTGESEDVLNDYVGLSKAFFDISSFDNVRVVSVGRSRESLGKARIAVYVRVNKRRAFL